MPSREFAALPGDPPRPPAARPEEAPGYAGDMPRRAIVPLLCAAGCLLALAITGLLALAVPAAHVRDAAILHGFMALDPARGHIVVEAVAHLVDVGPYAVLGLALIAVAALRGRARHGVAVGVLLIGTGATTQALKHLLATPRVEAWLGHDQIGAAAWPSGHATAAMTLALCAVLVAPAALRPLVAVAGGAFAVGVGYALLVLGWHYPSDVFAGYLVAGLWTSVAVAWLALAEPRTAARRERPYEPDGTGALGVAAGAAAAALAVVAAAALALRHDGATLYALERPTLVAGALAIAALAALLPGALAGVLSRAA
jgi:membrane-associated phospholipid phosphatase